MATAGQLSLSVQLPEKGYVCWQIKDRQGKVVSKYCGVKNARVFSESVLPNVPKWKLGSLKKKDQLSVLFTPSCLESTPAYFTVVQADDNCNIRRINAVFEDSDMARPRSDTVPFWSTLFLANVFQLDNEQYSENQKGTNLPTNTSMSCKPFTCSHSKGDYSQLSPTKDGPYELKKNLPLQLVSRSSID